MDSPLGTLDSFPIEITQRILTFAHPFDVAALSKTCRRAYAIVYGSNSDQYIWRQLFLLYPFDDPRKSLNVGDTNASAKPFGWAAELQARVRAEAVLKAGRKQPLERVDALQVLLSAIKTALPAAIDGSDSEAQKPSANLGWVEGILCESKFLESESLRSEISLRAKLLSYLALSLDNGKDDRTLSRIKQRRLKSRCFLYDLRNYRRDNKWGPYKSEGGINWVHVESIINVVSLNIMDLPPLWTETRPPTGLEATRAYSAPGSRNRRPEDWAGVEGTWRRYICFLDYRDLFEYNFTTGWNRHSFFEDSLFQEATRLIELSLKAIPEELVHPSIRLRRPLGVTLDETYPPIYFSGQQRGSHGNEATIYGSVRMGEDTVVKWQFLTIYGGQSEWSSEGIQIGNVASATGVVGVWTGERHEPGDPVGPYWLWKVASDGPSQAAENRTAS